MSKKLVTVAELYAEYESQREQGKLFYEKADTILAKLVRTWKKDKQAKIDDKHTLEIEDSFRGQMKAFAPAFAHRYKLKAKAVD
jgi:hypothetical protein